MAEFYALTESDVQPIRQNVDEKADFSPSAAVRPMNHQLNTRQSYSLSAGAGVQ